VTALQHVHLRVSDSTTGKPTACRVRCTDAAGVYYAPLGRLTAFATAPGVDVGGNVLAGGKPFAYIDGTCEILLPPGTIHVEVHKGPEYRPLIAEHHLVAGKLSLRLTIERWANFREIGWYSGDIRCHSLSPHAALLEGQAEDLAVVNVLARQTRDSESGLWSTPNLLAFSGQQPAAWSSDCLVAVNTFNVHPRLGSLALLHAHRIVYPLRFGGHDFDDWTLAAWCDQCHRKAGLVVWPAPSGANEGEGEGEALANAVLGKVDAIQLGCTHNGGALNAPDVWWSLAGEGMPLALVGGSAKNSNETVLGCVRTYAKLAPDEPFSYKAWIEAIRARRTFVTTGPLLKLVVGGPECGGLVDVAAQGEVVAVKAEAASASPFGRLTVHLPGDRRTVSAAGYPARAVVEADFVIRESGWIYATCHDAEGGLLAMTAPIKVRVEGRPPAIDRAASLKTIELLIATRSKIASEGRFSDAIHKQRMLAVFDQALERLAPA
jgi:hypothetical protein